jgi:hypothetical protein
MGGKNVEFRKLLRLPPLPNEGLPNPYERYTMNWIGPVVVVYALVCIVWTAAVIMQNFDEIRKQVLWSETRYGLFVAGVVFVMMTSPIWVPKIIIEWVQRFHQSVKAEMAKRES